MSAAASPALIMQLVNHQLLTGIKQRFHPFDKTFQPRVVFRLADLIQLFAQFQLFHQERGIANGMLLAGQIEAMQRKEIFCASQRMAQRLPGLVYSGGMLNRRKLFPPQARW